MSLNNWYPFYVGDYMRDTAQLSMIEHGAYRMLLDHYYSTGNPLPANEKQLHRICRAFDKQEQDAIAFVLHLFFEHDKKNDCYKSKRVDKELKKKNDISEKRSQAAKNKGKISKKNNSANAKQLQSKSKAIAHTSTSTSTSTPTITNNTPLPPKGGLIEIPNFINSDVWDSWVKHRSEIKKKLTRTQSEKQIEKLNKWHDAGHDVNEIITQSVANGWQGLFEPKGQKNGYNNRQTDSERTKQQLQEWVDEG